MVHMNFYEVLFPDGLHAIFRSDRWHHYILCGNGIGQEWHHRFYHIPLTLWGTCSLVVCGIIESTYLKIPVTFYIYIPSPLMMHVSSFHISLALLLGAANIEAFSVIHNSPKIIQKSQLMFTKSAHETFDFEVWYFGSNLSIFTGKSKYWMSEKT